MKSLFVFLVSLLGLVLAQCPPTPSISTSCDNCVSLDANNPVVPNSQTRCVPTGETMTISSISIGNNATLLVCGTLIFNGDFALSNNSSRVIVASGGSLYVTANLSMNSQTTFVNYGLINIQNNLTLNGFGSSFWNVGPSGVLTVGDSIVLNASANFINDGTNVQAFSLVLSGNATVCMTNGACFSLTNLTANGNGNVIVGNGTAAISYTGHANLNAQLTNTDDLYICQAPGATVKNPNNFGTQNVVSNYTSGCNVLSVIELMVLYRVEDNYLYIRWLCQGCPSNVTYEVSALTTIGETRYIGLTKDNHLTTPISLLPAGTGYVQITVLDNTKKVVIKRIVYYNIKSTDKLMVYPTIVENAFNVWYEDGSVIVELYDIYGRLIRQAFGCGTWDLSDLPSGVYLIIGHVNGRTPDPVRIQRR